MSLNLNTLIARARVAVAAGALVLVCAMASTPAHALIVPWADSGNNAGVANRDGATFGTPLGDTWNIINAGTTWAITTNALSQPSIFNLNNVLTPDGKNWATAFQYTINSGVAGIVSGTLFDITTGQAWNAFISAANQRITFDAPTGSQLSRLDQFSLDINFSGAIDPSTFSFSALWSDPANPSPPPSVPEPGTLSLIGAGLLGLYMMRRRFAGNGMAC